MITVKFFNADPEEFFEEGEEWYKFEENKTGSLTIYRYSPIVEDFGLELGPTCETVAIYAAGHWAEVEICSED